MILYVFYLCISLVSNLTLFKTFFFWSVKLTSFELSFVQVCKISLVTSVMRITPSVSESYFMLYYSRITDKGEGSL